MTDKIVDAEIVHETPQAIERVQRPDVSLVLSPVMDIATAQKRLSEFQEFVKGYLVEGEDFGTIPGTPKPTLYKPGASKLCELYGLADTYKIEKTEDFHADPPLFDYTVECSLWHRDRLVATGWGSCNSYESKYKLRDQQRICPQCGLAKIIKGQEQYGGGWLCWKKKDGCGAKFLDGDKSIEGQVAGKVLNDDIPTLKNTILKMAKKRALIDATLQATRSSGIFTQDVEDINAAPVEDEGSKKAAQDVAKRKIEEHKAKSVETIEFVCGPAGMVHLKNESGCNILRANAPEAALVLMVRLKNENCWAVPNEKALSFHKLAQRHNIKVNVSNDDFKKIEEASVAPMAAVKANIPPLDPGVAGREPGDDEPDESVSTADKSLLITSAKSMTAKKPDKQGHTKYMRVAWNGQEWNVATWHVGLFPLLTEAFQKQIPLKLITQENGKFHDVTGIEGAEKGQDGVWRFPIQQALL